jgi:hypothetical protein
MWKDSICTRTVYDEAAEANAVTGSLSKGLHAAIFMSIGIVVLAGGCNHVRSTPEDTSVVAHEVSQAFVGKQITVRGKFSSRTKGDPCVVLDNQDVWIGPRRTEDEDLYSKMDGELVEATGTLRFYHSPAPLHENETVQREPDHFYFEAGTTRLRRISLSP